MYNPEFREVLREHIDVLKNRARVQLVPDSVDVNADKFCFHRVMISCKLSQDLHWVIMRINEVVNPFAEIKPMKSFLIIRDEDLSSIKSLYQLRKQK